MDPDPDTTVRVFLNYETNCFSTYFFSQFAQCPKSGQKNHVEP